MPRGEWAAGEQDCQDRVEQVRWRKGEGATVTGAARPVAFATAHKPRDDRACGPVGAGRCRGGGGLATEAFRAINLLVRYCPAMQVLFEDDGDLKAGTVRSATDASLQVDSSSGKRIKVRSEERRVGKEC